MDCWLEIGQSLAGISAGCCRSCISIDHVAVRQVSVAAFSMGYGYDAPVTLGGLLEAGIVISDLREGHYSSIEYLKEEGGC